MVEKNKKKLLDKSQRVWYNMNTGTRVHKDAKHPSRNKIKKDFKKMLDRLENLWYNKDRKSQEGDKSTVESRNLRRQSEQKLFSWVAKKVANFLKNLLTF